MLINGRAGKFPIFAVSSLADFFNRKLQSANFLLRQMTENYILNVNEIELIDNLSHRYTMTPLVIDFDKVTIQGHQRQISEADSLSIAPLVTNEVFNKASYYSVYVVTYFLPFSGPIELFELAPSKRGFWIQEVFLESPRLKLNHLPQTEKLLIEIEEKCARDGEFLCFDILNLNHDAPAINKEVEQIINYLKRQLNYVNEEVMNLNNQIRTDIEQFFNARKQMILNNHQMLVSLGVPIKRHENLPQTYDIPTPQIQKKISMLPVVHEKGYIPEPTLEQSIYHDILLIIHDLGKVFERYPSIYSGKGEEALRDLILLYLAPRFGIEGSVTGETFNKSGKTDILISYKNSNVFVAECKFWKGEKLYLSTISQLLGYLTWRDSKAAIVIFVRNEAFSSVIQTVKKATSKHDNYLSFFNEEEETWLNYRFHINGDPNREVKIAVLLFSIPPVHKYIKDIVKMYHEAIINPNLKHASEHISDAKDLLKPHSYLANPPKHLGYLFCPECGSDNLKDSTYTDYEGDETHYEVMCEDCNWSMVTQ